MRIPNQELVEKIRQQYPQAAEYSLMKWTTYKRRLSVQKER